MRLSSRAVPLAENVTLFQPNEVHYRSCWPSEMPAGRVELFLAHVLLAGSDFGAAGEDYLRISYAASTEQIEEAVARMRAALAEL